MSQTRTETVQLTDGAAMRLTIAEPDNAVRGGLVVLHEALGVTDRTHKLAAMLAEEGWLTVAPHAYQDTDAACVWLADQGIGADRTGLIGFGLGGTAATVFAASRSVGAAVSVAGGGILEPASPDLPSLVDVAGELTCPWLGIYGDQDEDISVDEVEKLRDAASSASVATDVVRYPEANHRFDTDPDAAAEARQRMLNWFDSHLR